MIRRLAQSPHVRWRINIDAEIAKRVDDALFDAVRGKPGYGERSALVDELLREWLDYRSQEPDARDGVPDARAEGES